MPAMKTYKVIVSKTAESDLDEISFYVSGLYRPESGHNYVNRILGQLASLSYTADIYQNSRFAVAKAIHPNAKSPLSTIVGLWCFTLKINTSRLIALFLPK